MLAGFLPFEDDNIIALYKKVILFKRHKKGKKNLICYFKGSFLYVFISLLSLESQITEAQFTCPSWFSTGAKKLISRILDPNPTTVSGA
jgi:hypothetical protein